MSQDNGRTKGKLSRARAEKQIAATADITVLQDERFTKHANKHVVAKAAHKVAKLEAGTL